MTRSERRAMSLRTRIVFSNAVALALALLAAVVAIAGYWLALAPLRQAVVVEGQALQAAEQLRTNLAGESLTLQHALAANESEAPYNDANQRFDTVLIEAERLTTDPEARQALLLARDAEAQFNAEVARALAVRNNPAAALRVLADDVTPARVAADAALDQYLSRQDDAARRAERQAATGALVLTASSIAVLAVLGIVGAALSLRFSRHLLDRLSALHRATWRVAEGDRAVRLPLPPASLGPGDELDQLASAFNGMVMQLAEAEETARRVDELKASFLASISHDLRTPLTTIRGLLETLRRDDVEWDDASRREFLDVAINESARLTRLVTNILDLSRLEANAWPLHLEPLDVPALVGSLIEDLTAPGAPLAAHEVRAQGLPAPNAASAANGKAPLADVTPPALADELQIGRVLENLLTNAAKFSPPGSRIVVQIGRFEQPFRAPYAGPHAPAIQRGGTPAAPLVVRVSDEGPGVAPEEGQHVFEKFYRATTTPAATSGTGLGLAICHAIIEAHGGTIWLEHHGPEPNSPGATFAFTLPVVAPEEGDSSSAESRVAPAPGPHAAPLDAVAQQRHEAHEEHEEEADEREHVTSH